jgi:hypothetical protein
MCRLRLGLPEYEGVARPICERSFEARGCFVLTVPTGTPDEVVKDEVVKRGSQTLEGVLAAP